eukprot:3758-Heterococcus_DN1.PRE.1
MRYTISLFELVSGSCPIGSAQLCASKQAVYAKPMPRYSSAASSQCHLWSLPSVMCHELTGWCDSVAQAHGQPGAYVRDRACLGRVPATCECSHSYRTAACARLCSARGICCDNAKLFASPYACGCCLSMLLHIMNCTDTLRPCCCMCCMPWHNNSMY